ncbi:MAG: type IV pilin N-terminal domain-containing protein [Methanocalculus sp.]|jgi:FlaG/FlaF family flagellin (archaellin)|uniref:type IV pilin N-terminal domain-containing protein n=1 Tax=Methanocalculus sp. TaxID=2004547 RepID=UPI002725D652|nr:type IV pilin N-terminal domain-containing protein [Methanocalculus sp.]MDO9540229.1 type IV pilin N-terminal domain-containing protein [Methanocalculus sp.]
MNDDAVSPVVGEMLMLSLVLIMVSLFAVSIFNLIPGDREPQVSVMMDNSTDSISLYHKGGDWVRIDELSVRVRNRTVEQAFRSEIFILHPDTQTFDLGSNLTIPYTITGDEEVLLFTHRAVIFSGEVKR